MPHAASGPLQLDARVFLTAVALLIGLRDQRGTDRAPVVVSGSSCPRGDGYSPAALMTP